MESMDSKASRLILTVMDVMVVNTVLSPFLPLHFELKTILSLTPIVSAVQSQTASAAVYIWEQRITTIFIWSLDYPVGLCLSKLHYSACFI